MAQHFYYIDEYQQRRGPIDIRELMSFDCSSQQISITPTTYVWTYGMRKWVLAREVPELCSFFYQKEVQNEDVHNTIANHNPQMNMEPNHKNGRKHLVPQTLSLGLLVISFLIGLIIPSPFFNRGFQKIIESTTEDVVDTINMVLEGGTYSGTVIRNTTNRSGYGRYETNHGAVYEGNWKNNKLTYGTRTTASSLYTGHFDSELNNDGFGIIKYSDRYIQGKKSQGQNDSEITTTYIGNWRKNMKQGLGRSVKKDGSMEFGYYSDGILKKEKEAHYRIGGSVYGIDISHHQKNIDWDHLALYCDNNGNVNKKSSKDKFYMQPVFFAYLKATEGATIKDEMFSVRAIEAERHGIVKGAYHFLHLGSSIDAQLQNFLETVTWTPGDLPPALDIEVENEIKQYGIKAFQSMTLKWLQEVERKIGVCPIIYTRESIRNKYLTDSRFKKYQFWIARYSEKGPNNFDWQIWQRTEEGRMNGHKGYIDVNLFRGNYDAFMKYLGK